MGLVRHWPLANKIVCDVVPQDINGAAQGGNYTFTSLRNHHEACVLIFVGAHSGSAAAVTLRQAKNVEGNGSKALGFTTYYELQPNAGAAEDTDKWVEQTAASNTFNLTAQRVFAIPVRQAMLDVTGGFDCIRPQIAAPDAATLVAVCIQLGEGVMGIPGDTDHVPSAKVNRMPN